jgi:hypothetical protein
MQSPYTFKFHRMLPWNHLRFFILNFLLGNLLQIILVAMHGFHLVNSTHDLQCLSDGRTGWANVKRMGVVDRKAITNAGGLNTSAPCGRPPRTQLNIIHTGFARRRATTDDPLALQPATYSPSSPHYAGHWPNMPRLGDACLPHPAAKDEATQSEPLCLLHLVPDTWWARPLESVPDLQNAHIYSWSQTWHAAAGKAGSAMDACTVQASS